MKHFMQPRNTVLRENHPSLATIDTPSPSAKQKSSTNRKQKQSKENAPPSDHNTLPDYAPSPSIVGKPSPAAKLRSPLPPRPPSSNPLKRKLALETVAENAVPGSSDSGVKVVVRVRPPTKDEEDGDIVVQKLTSDSLSILGQTFTFDSVADAESRQIDVFQLVGAPLVENCLAGFNSSVFAYGQTGSGKTYTIWGPSNALLEKNLSSDQQGLTPRVFEQLFSRIDEEQNKHSDKQLMYQCRCSFLEIYNEQITDLLDPTQRNLQIREDIKTGVYVENLTEECVGSMRDVTQLLLKGLSNRRTGATSINAESSRSHSVFTCVVESRSKSVADGVSCFKSSRINLVDLAGSERQKLTGAAGERLKEAGNINRSLSQLGNLINILAEVSQTGKQRHIPYRDSKLTFLLQESLGGNAKLAMVCAISPAQSCKSETLSTLRFAQRAKAIKNKAVVNEEMQEDVNVLREVIRQLKDELVRVKANGNQTDPRGGYSTGWNARRSLSLLKFSLNRPLVLPHVDDDGDEEMEIVDELDQLEILLAGCEEKRDRPDIVQFSSQPSPSKEETLDPQINMPGSACIAEERSEDIDVNMEEDLSEQVDKHEIVIVHPVQSVTNLPGCSQTDKLDPSTQTKGSEESLMKSSDIVPNKDALGNSSNECLPSDNLLHEEQPRKSVGESSTCPSAEQNVSEEGAVNCVPNSPNDSGDCHDPNLSIVPCEISPVLKSPTPSVSPRVSCSCRKSLRTSSMLSASQNDLSNSNICCEVVTDTFPKPSKSICLNAPSTRTSKSAFERTEHLAASLHRGLEILDSHRKSSALRRSSFRFSYKPADIKPILVQKVDVGVQTLLQDNEFVEAESEVLLCSNCKGRTAQEPKDGNNSLNLQLVPVDGSPSTEKSKKLVPRAVEKVLAGAIRREMALEEFCAKQASEITHLNRLVQQYKHERECNAIIGETREDKIVRLESLMDGILSTEEFIEEELALVTDENKILKEKYENHPEILKTKIELKRVQDELERYRNFFDMGERDVLLEEIQDLRGQLQDYIDSSPKSARKRSPILQLTYSCDPSVVPPLCPIPESTEESAEQRLEQERLLWTETESKWISLAEDLKHELETSRCLVEKKTQELEMEKKCSEELKEAMQMAMAGHARMIEQYADLEEKHIQVLARQRRFQDGVDDVKKAASRAGVRGAESKFINTLAAEISALKMEREKEKRHYRDEIKGLQAQLRDTAEAVQAAGELLVRLKEAEEAVAAAQMQTAAAEQETERAYKHINKMKRKHDNEITTFHQLLAESRVPQEEASHPVYDSPVVAKYDGEETCGTDGDQKWREAFEPFGNDAVAVEGDSTKLGEPEPSSWFSGYDRCNI